MSLIYGMETFFLPRGLLMHSSSLSFQKTHIFHTGSYTLEFMLLLVLLLLSISTYIYANVKQNMQPNKSSKMKSKCRKFVIILSILIVLSLISVNLISFLGRQSNNLPRGLSLLSHSSRYMY